MPTIYTLADGRELREGRPFTGLDNTSYPANWLTLATPEDLAEHQITKQEVADEPPPPQSPPTPQALLTTLAGLRWAAEIAGTTWGELPLPTDRQRRSALKDAADKLRDGTLQSPIAVAFSNSAYASVTLEQLDAAIAIITVYVQKVFADAMSVAGQITAGTITTYDQLNAAWAEARAA